MVPQSILTIAAVFLFIHVVHVSSYLQSGARSRLLSTASFRWRTVATARHLTTADFRNGMTIEIDKSPMRLIEFQHVKPGKGAAFVRTKLKNLINGNTQEKTFRAGENIVSANVHKSEQQFTYSDDDVLCFADVKTFEELRVSKEKVSQWRLLSSGMFCQVTTFDDVVIDVVLPQQATCTVQSVTVNGGQKSAVVENDFTVNVPMFIETGEQILISTEDGKYVSRA